MVSQSKRHPRTVAGLPGPSKGTRTVDERVDCVSGVGDTIMSEIVVIADEPDEPSVPVDEVVDLIDSAITHVADAISEASDNGEHDDNMAFIAGVTVAALDALTGRVDSLELRVSMVESTATTAASIAVEALEEATTADPVTVEPEPEPEPDEPPDTLKTKANRAWFGKAKK